MNQKKNSIPKQISKPNPPTPEMIERAQFKDQDVQVEWEVSLIFDIETDGLLENVSTIHCLVIHDLETKQTYCVQRPRESRADFERGTKTQDADALLVTTSLVTICPVLHKLLSLVY